MGEANTPSKHRDRGVVVVEEYKVGPNDPKTISLPLTFLDTHLAGPIYVKRQFFYNLPPHYSSSSSQHHHFLKTLKHTLSLSLQTFFPLAGNLLCPPKPNKPFIQCTEQDTVSFKILESNSYDDFDLLSSNAPKNPRDLDQLVPKLTYKLKHDDEDTIVFPLLALQATLWEHGGLCIAITYCHVMDDRCCDHFMKTWSSLCRSKLILGGQSLHSPPPPCFDRQVLKDTEKLEDDLLTQYFSSKSDWKDKITAKSQSQNPAPPGSGETEPVKATVVFGSKDIKRMKMFALNQLRKIDIHEKEQSKAPPQYLSTFVVTCAFVWRSLVKTRHRDNDNNNEEDEEEEEEYFRFAADCTDRLGYTIPKTYFGNCIAICCATLKRRELNRKGEGGFVKAVRAIEGAINDMKRGPFREAKEWKASFEKMFEKGLVLVTGSPKFLAYDTDFGFGRPLKVEMKHSFKVMSLAESRDDKGGLEIGLLFRDLIEYRTFMTLIQQGLQPFTLSCS